jgi:hypothetical protein
MVHDAPVPRSLAWVIAAIMAILISAGAAAHAADEVVNGDEAKVRRLPAVPVSVVGDVERVDVTLAGDVAATRIQARLRLGADERSPTTDVLLFLPRGARAAACFLCLNFRGNQAQHPDPGIHPARGWIPDDAAARITGNRATEASRGTLAHRWPVETMLGRGYCMATASCGDTFPDRPVAGELPADKPGAIATWAWQLSRILDWLVTLPEIDDTKVAVVGHSRLGGAALCAGALDERFAMIVSKEAGQETDLPCDQHSLLALNGPRRLDVAGAVGDTIGRHVRSGRHDLLPSDWEQFADHADRHLRGLSPPESDGYPAFDPVQTPLPVAPPPGAVVLIGGDAAATAGMAFTSMAGGAIDWRGEQDELVVVPSGHNTNHLVSKQLFRDADIHAEFMISPRQEGNSGLYLHGHYEMQIFDSFGVAPVTEQDEGSLYRFAKPIVNAALPADKWQVYDIRFIAPRRDPAGTIVRPGRVTAWLNGFMVQNGLTFTEPRSPYVPYRRGVTDHLRAIERRLLATGEGPLFLQDHGSPTRYRNVWIKPLGR